MIRILIKNFNENSNIVQPIRTKLINSIETNCFVIFGIYNDFVCMELGIMIETRNFED